MGEFTDLLGKLEEFQKAAAPCDEPDKDDKKKMDAKSDSGDDKKIEAAAKDGEKESEKEKDETFGKAFKVKLEDGTETEAFDGTQMLKALHAENELLRATMTERDGELAKAMDIIVGELTARRAADAAVNALVTGQADLIKALQAKVETIGSAGVGRRTMLAIAEKLTPGATTATAPDEQATSPQQVMMKAQFLAREGKLDWGAMSRIEAHQGRGSLAPPDLLQRFPELLTPVP